MGPFANRRCPHVPERPLLVFQSKGDFFYNMSKQRISYPRTIPYSDKFVCRGSVEGWLFMANDYWLHDHNFLSSFFWKPVTDSTMKLPSELKTTNKSVKNPRLLKMVTTSSTSSPDFLVVILFDDYFGSQLAFCKISSKSWTVIEPENDTKGGITEIAVFRESCMFYLTN
ncbi:hypothetical protein L6164_013553 [Bauhinia variegata]|uniref:Uncharacterized protein n=1 Tax=Bauhinia variegata TaxID=167791 RepID=A0ACB9NEW3_BAUVA|nr:hypothetical protein L6164_013553 [Bauhinia variegata]